MHTPGASESPPFYLASACPCPPSLWCRWFKSRAHAAELTAGYYNTRERNGYQPIMEMLKQHGAAASFTCVEMRDCEHPLEARCSPEGLLNQVRRLSSGRCACSNCPQRGLGSNTRVSRAWHRQH